MDINNINRAERLITLLGKLERAKELTHAKVNEITFGVKAKTQCSNKVIWLDDPDTVSLMQEAIESRILQVRAEIGEL